MTKAAIICVDDDFVILNSLGEQLKRSLGQEYDLELVDSAAEAVALCAELVAEEIEIPLIISDQIMPGMTGDRLLIQLHSLYPKSLKILLTGQADADAVGSLVNAAALYRYVTKPWNETDLILTVKEALKRYHQEQQLAAQNEILRDVNQQLTSSISLLQATLEATADGILVLDNGGQVVSYNQKLVDIWGVPSAVKIDRQQLLNLFLEQLADPYADSLRKNLTQSAENIYDCLELKNGRILEYYSKAQQLQEQTVGRVWSFRDVTEQKKALTIIQHQAFHDSLTNLPNRHFFEQQLIQALNQAHSNNQMLAVMFLDLDRFKIINDTLGHAVGDLLLKKVVERLKHCLRPQDFISRWGGDEFTLLLPEISHRENVTTIASRILEILKPGFDLDGHYLHISSSMGIAIFPDDGKDADTLLKNADAALYRVKDQGRNNYQFYTLTINSQAYELLNLENDLHFALEREELILYYQPIVEVTTGKIVKMEALIRWQHPNLGLLSPNLFIPIAEENGLIISLGEWVIQTACAQNKIWQEMGLSPVKVAVNLSVRQFCNHYLVATVAKILQKTGLNPYWLELEITETTTIQNTDITKEILLDLNQMGVSLAMDDFGTGYSSLSYIKDFPFHTIKIDSSFIKDLRTNSKNLAIINVILALGKELNMQIIAEGVESEQLKKLLENLHCEYMQGYFFSPPVTVDQATNLLVES
ncbi:bifunctional diguanylate cyclase/phosphodiesterase [Pleurocapsa sp. PCC 7319]|uniref:putative bifunctional diguanylate cyclase/phosphodiesterase n=1 Tax=Pleurocapsa sp. PCC 7319 TaxID=118161 RepID=UPI00034C6DE4|nr:EAL domain-containing protein [Pleurocapsa sp. PCC 7319]